MNCYSAFQNQIILRLRCQIAHQHFLYQIIFTLRYQKSMRTTYWTINSSSNDCSRWFMCRMVSQRKGIRVPGEKMWKTYRRQRWDKKQPPQALEQRKSSTSPSPPSLILLQLALFSLSRFSRRKWNLPLSANIFRPSLPSYGKPTWVGLPKFAYWLLAYLVSWFGIELQIDLTNGL